MERENQRAAIADPENTHYFTMALSERARIEGESVYLEALQDIDKWKASSALIQEIAARVVLSRLGAGFEYAYPKTAGMRDWECDNYPLDMPEPVPQSFKHRLASYRHKATGIEFVLLPGMKHGKTFSWTVDKENLIIVNGPMDSTFNIYYHGHLQIQTILNGNTKTRIILDQHHEGIVVEKLSEPESIKPFLIARWPSSGLVFKKKNGLPLTGLSFGQVTKQLENCSMRLPSTKEWTFAAKAGTTTRFYWGDEMDDSHVWHSGNSRFLGAGAANIRMPHTHAPKEHDDAGKWNAFGLVDMIGNVSEWVTMPSGFPTYMGGDYTDSPNNFEPTSYIQESPQDADYYDHSAMGFRPCLSIPGEM